MSFLVPACWTCMVFILFTLPFMRLNMNFYWKLTSSQHDIYTFHSLFWGGVWTKQVTGAIYHNPAQNIDPYSFH